MKTFSFSAIALSAFFAIAGSAQAEEPPAPQTPTLAISISASFPNSEVFGTKLVNGRPTRARLDVTNNEPESINIEMVGGSLWTVDALKYGPSQIIRNLSTTRFNVEIPGGEKESLTYTFVNDLQPQDLRLSLMAVVKDHEGSFYTVQAFNETVAVVEQDSSIFDPQIIFLYLLLGGGFVGTIYFIYNTWITTLFPQAKKSRGKGGERAKGSTKGSTKGSKRVDPSEQVAILGADGPAVASKATAYDESWLPEGHLKRPEQKRSKSGTPRKTPAK